MATPKAKTSPPATRPNAELTALLEKAMKHPGVAEVTKVYDKYRQCEKVNQVVALFQNWQSPTAISVSTSSAGH